MKGVFRALARFSTWIVSLYDSGPSGLKKDGDVTTSIPAIIPGDSNLEFCPESRDTDLFSMERISVYPTPPLLYPAPFSSTDCQ